MGKWMIVSKVEQLADYIALANAYHVAFEINDFFQPSVLEDELQIESIIRQYMKYGIPEGSTLHGAFMDIVVFSNDPKIREVSVYRMRQSMEIAKRMGVSGVVFHTNINPMLDSIEYQEDVVRNTVEVLSGLLTAYQELDLYLENMFDATPDLLCEISRQLAGYSNYGICFDYAHAMVFGEDVDAWAQAVAPYVKHVHVNDNDLKHDLHLAIGDGAMDWGRFETLYQTYFSNCSVLIETTSPQWQHKSLEYLKNQTKILH
ncbi:MAG: TIM barrel protein [Eubacteriales bacterium]|nr:TIM barrel protein [Eubacteriales bacterium]